MQCKPRIRFHPKNSCELSGEIMNTSAIITSDDNLDEWFYDRVDGSSLHHYEQPHYNSDKNEPMYIYCHRTRCYAANNQIFSKAAYLQVDVMHPDRFDTSVHLIIKWLREKDAQPWSHISAIYTDEFWATVLDNIRKARLKQPIIETIMLESLAQNYRALNPKFCWMNFLAFLINDYPTTSHAAVLVAVMTTFLDRRVIYYELLLLMNAIDQKLDADNPYQSIVASLCDCILFNICHRWNETGRFPPNKILKSGSPNVHLHVYKSILKFMQGIK